jgi:hypothetical protein
VLSTFDHHASKHPSFTVTAKNTTIHIAANTYNFLLKRSYFENKETYAGMTMVQLSLTRSGLPLQISKFQDTKNPKFQDISRTF